MKSHYRNTPVYKTYTKLQLIKRLKADNLYNYETVKNLDTYDNYIYSKGTYSDLYQLSDRGREGAYKRIETLLETVLDDFPEEATRKEIIKLKSQIVFCVKFSVQESDIEAVEVLLPKLLETATVHELNDFSFSNLEYSLDAEEYISISVGASIWSFYISGSVTLEGKEFSAKNVSYRASEATRL